MTKNDTYWQSTEYNVKEIKTVKKFTQNLSNKEIIESIVTNVEMQIT